MAVKIPFNYQGSKLKELPRIQKLIGTDRKIAEPFFGSGIITGHLGMANGCVANELNKDVFNIWKYAVEDNAEFFEMVLLYCDEKYKNEETYYQRRDEYNKLWKEDIYNTKRAALFYYLLSTCHSGLVRYGPNGFNTSFFLLFKDGRTRKINVVEKVAVMRHFAKNLRSISNSDALEYLKNDDLGVDIIYCDPPYINSISVYQGGWGQDEYQALIDILKYQNRKNGIVSLISNYTEDKYDAQYDEIIKFQVPRRAGAKGNTTSEDVIGIIGKLNRENLEKFF